MQTFTKILLFSSILLLAGCGGGGEDLAPAPAPAPAAPSPPVVTLSNAQSFSEFVSQVMPFYFNASTVDRLKQYDNDFMSFPDTTMLLDSAGRRPIGASTVGDTSEWSLSVTPGQGFANEHPAQTASMRLVGTTNPRVLGYSAIDYITGLTGEGEAKLFWGIKNIDYTKSPNVPIVMVIEQIVRNQGAAQYRAIAIIEGVLLAPITPGSNPLLGIRANYNLYSVEAFNGGSVGQLLSHRICLSKPGFIGSAYQPSGNWCS